MNVFYATMGYVADVVGEGGLGVGNLQEAVFESLIGKILLTKGVHHAQSIHLEMVGIHVWGGRTQRNGPQTGLSIPLHGVLACELHIDFHLFGVVVFVKEGYCAVRMADGGVGRFLLGEGVGAQGERQCHHGNCLHE